MPYSSLHLPKNRKSRSYRLMKEYITKRVHELYWNDNINCARTALTCLSELFQTVIEPQTIWSAVGLHGAGGYRAQCGLVEGTLMFIGIYFHILGKTECETVSACYHFASAFDKEFGSLRCFELQPYRFFTKTIRRTCRKSDL